MWIVADVTFDTDAEAREAERLVRENKMPGVSVDLTDVTSEIEIKATDEEGFPTDWLETVTEAEIIGATQVAMPAFADARLEVTDTGVVAWLVPEGIETSDRRLIASGALRWRDPAPLMFNTSSDGHMGSEFVGNLTNFRRAGDIALVAANPELTRPMRPVVHEGKIVGHGAAWGTCHTAFKNACVEPPDSTMKHVIGGIPIYRHPRGDVHAPLSLKLEDAQTWYALHCEEVGIADVGTDEHGIWVAGENVILADGEYSLSGDWRNDNGTLELISFLVVENPGFPVARVANDVQMALIGAGAIFSDGATEQKVLIDPEELEAMIAEFRARRRAEIDGDLVELDVYFALPEFEAAFNG